MEDESSRKASSRTDFKRWAEVRDALEGVPRWMALRFLVRDTLNGFKVYSDEDRWLRTLAIERLSRILEAMGGSVGMPTSDEVRNSKPWRAFISAAKCLYPEQQVNAAWLVIRAEWGSELEYPREPYDKSWHDAMRRLEWALRRMNTIREQRRIFVKRGGYRVRSGQRSRTRSR